MSKKFKMKKYFLFVCFLLILTVKVKAQPGVNDTTFNPAGQGADNRVYTTVLQSDGKIIIAGLFTTYNGTTINRIARLNTNGSLDTAFHQGAGANNDVYTTTLQSDGKIIIAGLFTTYNGTTINRIARLNTDGSLDTAFNSGAGANNYIAATAMQSDGKIIIVGDFTTYNGTARCRVARLNPNGSLDTTFNSGTGATCTVYATAVQSDGKVIIGGAFIAYDGTAINRIARLNMNGSIDTTFNPGAGANANVYTTVLQNDGKIIIGGAFAPNNGVANRIARLNTNGSLDTTFNSGTAANGIVYSTALQGDGKIIIGGDFTIYNGTAINRIARLNTNGSLDVAFDPGAGTNASVYTTALQSDGKIIIGGDFTNYDGTGGDRIARIVVREAVITEIKENSNAVNLIVYPNPVKDKLMVNSEQLIGKEASTTIYDVLGNKVYQSKNRDVSQPIDIGDIAKGVYFIQLITQNKIVTAKFIKE